MWLRATFQKNPLQEPDTQFYDLDNDSVPELGYAA